MITGCVFHDALGPIKAIEHVISAAELFDITDRIVNLVKEWQKRPLKAIKFVLG